jgi:hypothetical protein
MIELKDGILPEGIPFCIGKVQDYCAPQREGKTTLMVRDTVKLTHLYRPEDILCNFPLFIPGVVVFEENADLIDAIFEIKRKRIRHKLILFDEVGQELRARESMNKRQIEMVTFAWQMPKRDISLLYCSNPGNSADIILRLATRQTLMPKYHHGPTRDDDYMDVAVIYNYELWIANWRVWGLVPFQKLFDSFAPIG